jgi:tRNA pseudouridine(38-40) synthase
LNSLLIALFLVSRRELFLLDYVYRSTSGRTDKGVHACAQVVSAKIELLPYQTLDQVRDELNKVLPDTFRVLDVKRTTRNFCAHTQRDRVRYQYMIPAFALIPADTLQSMFEAIGAHKTARKLKDPLTKEELKQLQTQLKESRVTEEQLTLLKKALKSYEGTHPFQSFSKGIKPGEARANRFIEYFRVEDPIVFEDGTQWIPTQVLGQSFLIHQIRKMACMAIDVTRGAVPFDTMERALSKTSDIIIAPAPAQGLYLDMSFYTGYNRRKQSNPDLPDLDWTQEDSPEFTRWHDFRNNIVMKHVVEEEAREGNFIQHLFRQQYGFDYEENYQLDDSTSSEMVN